MTLRLLSSPSTATRSPIGVTPATGATPHGAVERDGIGAIDGLVGVPRTGAARGERHQRDQGEAARHDYSGVHA